MFNRLIHLARRSLNSIMEPAVTAETLAYTYSTVPDEQLRILSKVPLTPTAREALQAEFARRKLDQRPSRKLVTP
jgi:hypothetical protein